MPVSKIDLNSDVGESFGNYKLGLDEDVIPLISSANIACGFHAGDPTVMRRTIAIAGENGVAIGAHPGFPDLIGFGRRNLNASLEEIKDYVTYQIGAIQAFAVAQGVKLQHVKPHGALYTMAVKNTAIWDAVAEAVAAVDSHLILFVLAGPDRENLEAISAKHGIRLAYEFFGDRAYNSDGSLVSRTEPGAVIHDSARVAEKVLKMVKEGRVVCKDDSEIELKADTICVHGDNPSALSLVKKIRETLQASEIEIVPPAEFLF
jgi:5-oxoprolinase (ATP-hydrolysing) subunit A